MKSQSKRFQWYCCASCATFVCAEFPNNLLCLNCNKYMYQPQGAELNRIIKRRRTELSAKQREDVEIIGLVPEEELLEMLWGL